MGSIPIPIPGIGSVNIPFGGGGGGGGVAGGVLQAINPLNWISGWVTDINNELVSAFTQYILHTPQPVSQSTLDILYGNARGLAPLLAIAITSVVIVMAMLFQKMIKNAIHGILVIVLITAGSQLWFNAFDIARSFGESLAQAAQFYHGSGGGKGGLLSQIPGINNPLLGVIGLGSVAFSGGTLVAIFFVYELIIIVAKFAGLICFAIAPFGDRAKKFFDWLVAFGLVATLFGRPTAIFCLEIGKLFASATGNSVFSTVMCTILGIMLAIGAQILLVISAHKGIAHVTGKMWGATTVTGKVSTTSADRQKVDVNRVNSNHAETMQPVGAQQGQKTSQQKMRKAGKDHAVKEGVAAFARHHAGDAAKKKVLAAAGPEAAIAVGAIEAGRGMYKKHKARSAKKKTTNTP